MKSMNVIILYLILSILISSYLCMDEKGKDFPIWKTGSWIIGRQISNPNLDQVAGIGFANNEKPLKLNCNPGKS